MLDFQSNSVTNENTAAVTTSVFAFLGLVCRKIGVSGACESLMSMCSFKYIPMEIV